MERFLNEIDRKKQRLKNESLKNQGNLKSEEVETSFFGNFGPKRKNPFPISKIINVTMKHYESI
jgi:hypothetical protein